jgi:hypothetical protein
MLEILFKLFVIFLQWNSLADLTGKSGGPRIVTVCVREQCAENIGVRK